MKKEQNPDPLFSKSRLLKALLMITFSLYCFAVSAQEKSATAITPGSGAVASSNSKIAEYAKANPQDLDAQRAMKNAMILDNPAAFPEFKQADLDRISKEQTQLLDRVNFMEQQLNNGTSYDKASAMYEREMKRKLELDKATNPNRANGSKPAQQPASETAPAMMNGNN
jgi:hypothetical protein